eukprot:1158282-Pelagomonas_calceolata.AAC.6
MRKLAGHAITTTNSYGFRPCSYSKPGSEAHLSMQLRWRAVALQALHAYMAALLAKGHHASTTAQVEQQCPNAHLHSVRNSVDVSGTEALHASWTALLATEK